MIALTVLGLCAFSIFGALAAWSMPPTLDCTNGHNLDSCSRAGYLASLILIFGSRLLLAENIKPIMRAFVRRAVALSRSGIISA